MEDRKRDYQAGQLARLQEMVLRCGAPPCIALQYQECFHDEHAAGRHQPEESRHAGSVKIIEYQNCIKTAQIRPLTLEIQLSPVDGDALAQRPLARACQP